MRANSVDLLIVFAYFVSIIGIGYFFRRKSLNASDYFHAGCNLPTSITSLAFLSANCGALEVLGMVASSAKYGALTLHFYWVGAIPAMLFLSLFMMPIYLKSNALSIPEFLKLRFNDSTRVLNAISFSIMMVLTSGISLYALAEMLRAFLGWNFAESTLVGAGIVLIYVALGGLTATMYTEVVQFFLILLGLIPLVIFILRDFHGLHGLMGSLPSNMIHAWKGVPLASPELAPMDIIGILMGLGFVLGFGYWCTDFLLIQRALAARSAKGAIQTPLLAATAKLFFPLLLVIPGLASAALFRTQVSPRYDQALPATMQHYYGHGLLGIGITAILASLISGVGGSVMALNVIWTHDLYRAYIAPAKTNSHYIFVGRVATVIAIILSIFTAYIALRFNDLMDYLQLLFSLFNAPLFATFLLGMFTKWATPKGGFWGLLLGTAAGVIHNLAFRLHWLHYGSDMSANFYGAICAWTVCFIITTFVSLFTEPLPTAALAAVTYSRRSKALATSSLSIWVYVAFIATTCVILDILFQ
jgi:SSS family solute:Na+ symporter